MESFILFIYCLGAFFMYAGLTSAGFVLFYFITPETRGLQIDEVENLFKTPAERHQTQLSRKRTDSITHFDSVSQVGAKLVADFHVYNEAVF